MTLHRPPPILPVALFCLYAISLPLIAQRSGGDSNATGTSSVDANVDRQNNVERISPALVRDLALQTVAKTIKRGETFSLRIVLEKEGDVFLIGAMDLSKLRSVSITRSPEAVIFTLLATGVGQSELVIDRISDSFQSPFIRYQITVEPSDADILEEIAKKERARAKESLLQKLTSMVRTFLAEGNVEFANEIYNQEMGNVEGNVAHASLLAELIEALSQNEQYDLAKATLAKAQDLFKDQENEILFRLTEAKLLIATGESGESASARTNLMEVIKNNLKTERPEPESPQLVAFAEILFLLGEIFSKEEQWGSARSRFIEYLSLFSDLSPEQQKAMTFHRILAHYRIAEGYYLDDQGRDVALSMDFYNRVIENTENIDYTSEQASRIVQLRTDAINRKTFLDEYFLQVK